MIRCQRFPCLFMMDSAKGRPSANAYQPPLHLPLLAPPNFGPSREQGPCISPLRCPQVHGPFGIRAWKGTAGGPPPAETLCWCSGCRACSCSDWRHAHSWDCCSRRRREAHDNPGPGPKSGLLSHPAAQKAAHFVHLFGGVFILLEAQKLHLHGEPHVVAQSVQQDIRFFQGISGLIFSHRRSNQLLIEIQQGVIDPFGHEKPLAFGEFLRPLEHPLEEIKGFHEYG